MSKVQLLLEPKILELKTESYQHVGHHVVKENASLMDATEFNLDASMMDTLENRLQSLIDASDDPWTYAIFWKSSSIVNHSGPPLLGWGDGYYKGEFTKPKTTVPFPEQQFRKKVLLELNSMISGSQTPENGLVEVVIDMEWFFLISMTQSLLKSNGLVGQMVFTNQPVWVTGKEQLMVSNCRRAHQGLTFGLQTIVCIPCTDGVIELGSTELIFQNKNLLEKVRVSFNTMQINTDQVIKSLQIIPRISGLHNNSNL